MKTLSNSFVIIASTFAILLNLNLKGYGQPHWDVSNPGYFPLQSVNPLGASGAPPYGSNQKIVARNGVLYSVTTNGIYRWSKYYPKNNGWQLFAQFVAYAGAPYTDVQITPYINAITIHGDDLYVGGYFSEVYQDYPFSNAVPVSVNNVAKFNLDTWKWAAVGNTFSNCLSDDYFGDEYVSNVVNAITIDNQTNVYVYLQPDSAFSFGPNNNSPIEPLLQELPAGGNTWIPLGTGMYIGNGWVAGNNGDCGFGLNEVYGELQAIATDGTNVFVGGAFSYGVNADSSQVLSPGIIKWNGTNWQAMGSGIAESIQPDGLLGVNDITVSGTNVFVCGDYRYETDQSPGSPGDCVLVGIPSAGWDVSQFSTSGSLISAHEMTYHGSWGAPSGLPDWWTDGAHLTVAPDGSVFLLGVFDHIDSIAATNIAEWNGSGWSALGDGISGTSDKLMYITADANALYVLNVSVAGDLDATNGTARWVTGAMPDPPPSPLYQLSVGDYHTLAISNGFAWAWGDDNQLQLGNFIDENMDVPASVGLGNVVSVAAGSEYSLWLTQDGTVWFSGQDYWGQMGDLTINEDIDIEGPSSISGISNVVSIAAGADFGLAVKADGTVWGWGHSGNGCLGNNSPNPTTPHRITTNAVAVAGGESFTLVLMADGTVWGCGDNSWGELGDGTTTTRTNFEPVTDLTNVIAIAAAANNGFALLANGNVMSWGVAGGNGDGTDTTRTTPVQVLNISNIVAIAGGSTVGETYSTGHALQNNGTVWSWGINDVGQMGDGVRASGLGYHPVETPVQASTAVMPSVTTLPGGGSVGVHMVVFGTDKNLYSWGDNNYGELGNGTTTLELAPVAALFSY
ncbi:MAG TPA: hypothetical protein VGI03_05170 [Verrucomicrobiae bacterium]|jgi:alpha-tubulin suppressor-like RCC1 family protein